MTGSSSDACTLNNLRRLLGGIGQFVSMKSRAAHNLVGASFDLPMSAGLMRGLSPRFRYVLYIFGVTCY